MAQEAISSVLTAMVKYRLDKNIRAVLLSGSLSKGEGTILRKKSEVKVLSDMDLHFVLKYPWDFFLLRKKIEVFLENLTVPFEVSVGLEWRMNGNRTIQSYELKKSGKVLFGDPFILDSISMDSPTQIPRWEGIRLLLNRVIELINVLIKYETADSKENFDAEFYYVCMKAYLACCDDFLLLENQFAPSCQERYEQFVRLFKSSHLRKVMPDLDEKVTEAIKFKLNLRDFSEIPRLQNMRLWFDCRDTVIEILKYSLSVYLKTENKKLESLLAELEKRIPRGNSGILYFLESLIRDKKLVSPIVLKPPRLYAQIAGVYHAQALNKDKTANLALTSLALKYLMMFEKSQDFQIALDESFAIWKKIGAVICNFSMKTPDIFLKKDF
jgi:hypothetical protein